MNNPDRNCRIYLDPSVRWTDKVTLCANGDIVEDFSGKIVGHITPDVYEEINKRANGDFVGDCSGKIIGYITPDNRFKEAEK